MDPLAPLIETLHAGRRPRVWSLIVTVFGDAVLPRGGEVPLGRLQILLGRMGVEAGTIRTALSRLGQDGWVARRREGRLSFYHLSESAAAETRAAMTQIYAPPTPADQWGLHLGVAPSGNALQIGPAAWLAPVNSGKDAFLSAAPLTSLPKRVLAPDHRAALELLEQDLSALPPEAPGALSPLDAAAARILLIHRWRRFALRYPQPLPAPDPRVRVASAYRALFDASEAWLDSKSDGLVEMPSPAPQGALQMRFQRP
jgi:phenylacetic acid degradation operon negative regulatory protein